MMFPSCIGGRGFLNEKEKKICQNSADL